MPNTKKTFDFKIGADPEFILTMQGRKVDAQQTMQLMLKSKPELIPENMGYKVKNYGNIGWDGASSTGEIRPSASNDPQEIINNIAGLFQAMTKYIKICDLSTLSEYSSVGGHIHFEQPKGESWSNEKISTIHRRLASFYLPILISENKTNLNLRLKQSYGSLKDHRIEKKFSYPDGTPGFTFEFRVPSAEWLTCPKVAKATLSYMAVIYHEILNNPKSFSKFTDLIYKSDKQGDALQSLAITEFSLLTDSILKMAKKYIRTFEMYPAYKKEIEYILNPKQVIKDKKKADYNIVRGWNLAEKTALPKKNDILSSKKKIQEIAEKQDFDTLKRVMNITYNDDTNVANFAECLKDRVAAFNWKLKNNYYIFGMRKGIEAITVKNMKNEYLAGTENLKTILDKEYMDKLFNKMNDRFMGSSEIRRNATIDFTTGKPKDIRESVVTIGLPYDMRVKEDVRPFLNMIWSIEKGELPIAVAKKTDLIDDRELSLDQQGTVFKILTKKTEQPQEVVMDEGSNSLRSHERVVQDMVMEAETINN